MRVWRAILGWVPHEAHSETRIQGQVVYLGDDSRKNSREDRKGDTERKRAHKGHTASELLLWATGAQHPWRGGTGRPQRTSRVLSPWKERKLRYSSTNSIHHWVGPFLETETPCDFRAILLAGQVSFQARTKPSFRESQV